ncbi:hypothetical protein FisN_1Hh376 [Fistulifera solaris]|uniref:Kinesin motor domain-containing protein n=1 Tax=Fistulifera solaris TaxID=1519565 RepID=A0A1Z5KH65_FISSO|nr:hypothetical protein FisN_1Hh376 [Fistulifera solaris]|eukprot:GAX25422.1 hypothetical protein FisN_1Hh376 [Fistulifera solaris]
MHLTMATAARKEPVKVFLRLRPLSKQEETSGCSSAAKSISQTRVSVKNDTVGEYQTDFDSVFDSSSDQEVVFQRTCVNVPQQLLDGFDCAIFAYGAQGSGKTYSILGNLDGGIDECRAEDGIVPRLARSMFDAIRSSDPAIEFTVRCSVVEIYLDRLRDLLVDSCHVRAVEGKLRGCSRLSCLSPEDITTTVNRGHAARTGSSIDPCRESIRSSMIIQVEIEQYDSRSQSVRSSTLLIGDLVGSECSTTGNENRNTERSGTLVSNSLNTLKRLVEERRSGVPVTMPITAPPVAQLLSPYLGGSSHTMILLTASTSDAASKETIDTFKFGELCRSIHNTPAPHFHERWQDCSAELMEARENNLRFEELVRVLASECHRLHSKSGARFSSTTLENVISEITEATTEHRDIKFTIETKAEHQIRTEQMKLRSEMRRAVQTRDELLSSVSQMQSDLQLLKDQNIRLLEGKETTEAELARLKNEVLVARAQKEEAEYNLRTSRFRENEAVVFLRQFRRFYFRLRKQMATDGSGNVGQIIQEVPGAPSLDKLVDIDSLMVESGLLEEHEIGGDIDPYIKTSPEAMAKSSNGAIEMMQSKAYMDEKASFSKSAIVRDNSQSVEARQRLHSTPAGKYLEMREHDLESELLSLSEKASHLERSLVEEKQKVETLTKSVGVAAALDRLKSLKESKIVKDQLEKKEHDLNAVIWKMNEMHMAGKSLRAMVLERDNRILHLENTFTEASSKNTSLVLEKERGDNLLRDEIAELSKRIRAFSSPIRFFGEQSNENTPFHYRLVAPFSSSKEDLKADSKNALRRASIGEAGEWIKASNALERADVETQTDYDRVDGECQTQMKEVKDTQAQTDLHLTSSDLLVDAETQTEKTHKMNGDFIPCEVETQTDGVLLTLKDIELSTIEAAASSIPEANVDDLLFMITRPEENIERTQISAHKESLGAGVAHKNMLQSTSLSANAFLFMEDDVVEDALHKEKGRVITNVSSARDTAAKQSTAVATSSSRILSSSSLSVLANQATHRGPSEMANSNHSRVQEISVEKDNVIVASSDTTHEKYEQSGESATALKDDKEITDEGTTESKPGKPVSSFLAKLQAQARKKAAEQSSDVIEKETVPEFMKKFKTIGARNANESVIETSGESTSLRQPFSGGTRFADTSSSIPWHPRKKKNEDDDSEDNEGSFTFDPVRKNLATELPHESSTISRTEELDHSDATDESGPQAALSSSITDDKKDSSSDEDDKKGKTEAQVAKPAAFSSSPKADNSDSSSDEEDDNGKAEPQALMSAPFSTTKADDGSDSSSDDDNDKRKAEVQTSISVPFSPSSKADDDSDSSSDEDDDNEETAEPQASKSVPVSSSKIDDDGDSSSDDDVDKEKTAELQTSKSTPFSSSKADDDSDSSNDDEDNNGKAEPQASRSAPYLSSKADDDSDSSSDEDNEKRKAEVPTATPVPLSSSSKADDDSDSSSDGDDDKEETAESRASKSVPFSSSKSDDDSDSSSEEEDHTQQRSAEATALKLETTPLEVRAPPGTSTKVSKADSSSDDDDEEDVGEKINEQRKPVTVAKTFAGSLEDSSDESEEDSDPIASTSNARSAVKSSNVPVLRAPAQITNDSEDSSSSDTMESDDESTEKNSSMLLQGGKPGNFEPKRKVTDFGEKVSPALSPKKPEKAKMKSSERDVKGKPEAKAKTTTKGDKPGKGKASKVPAKSSSKSTTDTKSSKFAVRGSDIVLADDGEWGKSASKKSVKAKSSFVIKNGKLVKNEASSPPPTKIEKPAFKIVGGKLVKQGKGDGGTKKAAGKSRSRMGEI